MKRRRSNALESLRQDEKIDQRATRSFAFFPHFLELSSNKKNGTSWLPRIKCTAEGCSILSASNKQMVSSECEPRST